jgi:hypothetical protein
LAFANAQWNVLFVARPVPFRLLIRQMLGQVSMFGETPVGAHGPPLDDAWLRHRRRDNGRLVGLLCKALVKEIAFRARASKGAFIDGAAIARSKKPSDAW